LQFDKAAFNIGIYNVLQISIRFDSNCSKDSIRAQLAVLVVSRALLHSGFSGICHEIFETAYPLTLLCMGYAVLPTHHFSEFLATIADS
jgi:hypothetical protein